MELREIGERLGIEHRTLRYVAERGIVPGLSRVNKGRGNRRKLSVQQARSVGLAASLYQSGLRGELLGRVLRRGIAGITVDEVEFGMSLGAVQIHVDLENIRKKIS